MNKLREVQLVQLEILVEFDRVCTKCAIPYQLFAGTLLGAVRHRGFIPWDDDVDVCMLRSDYDRFLELAQRELGGDFFLQTAETDPEYLHQFARIRKNGTYYHQMKFERFNIHKGIFIDIFPLDDLTENPVARTVQMALIRFVRHFLIQSSTLRKRPSITLEKNPVLRIAKWLYREIFKLPGHLPLRRMLDALYCMHNRKLCRFVTHLTNGVQDRRWDKYRMPRTAMSESVMLEFEGHRFPGPAAYDEQLTRLYGNYLELPPAEARISNHLKVIT